jgi:hypothetical protein
METLKQILDSEVLITASDARLGELIEAINQHLTYDAVLELIGRLEQGKE